MQPLPHLYTVTSVANAEGNVGLYSNVAAPLEIAPPPEYGGPDDLWSPETCLVGAVASCYVLSFRAIARAASLDWLKLNCEVSGTLEKLDGMTQFTQIGIVARLQVSSSEDAQKAKSLLTRAEKLCLITNSLTAEVNLVADVQATELVAA